MAAVRYTASAEEDLLEIWISIAQGNPGAADRILDVLEQAARLIARHPRMGRERPELGVSIRSFATKTPYILFYVDDRQGVIIDRVLHHARDIDALYSDE
jgi:toxin ParE1/3/4